MRKQASAMAAALAVACSGPVLGGYTITQGSSAPAYSVTLNFDEPGGPTGVVSPDAWSVTHNISDLQAGDGIPFVGDNDPGWGLGDGNSFFGNFGVFITWDNVLDALSLEVWDPAGPPSPLGGGMGIFVFNDGIEVASSFVTPAWGGIGDTWFDITSDGGDVFDEVRFLGFGFPNTTYADNISWNKVPAPGAFALLGLAGLVGRRRGRVS